MSLIAHWKMDDNAADGIVTDIVGGFTGSSSVRNTNLRSVWDKHGSQPLTFSFTEVISKPVWKLAYAGENIFAGTGDEGYILRSNNGYHWENFYKTDDYHVTALYVYNNILYSGTSPHGMIYMTDLTTKTTTLSQKVGGDVVSFVDYNNDIYMATNNPVNVYKFNITTNKWDSFYKPYTSCIYKLYVDNNELSILVK
jgi:hypothetical protein